MKITVITSTGRTGTHLVTKVCAAATESRRSPAVRTP
jgi:hypothetical protein